MAIGDGDLAVTGRVTAGNIRHGHLFIQTVTDTVVNGTVFFGDPIQGSGDINVFLTVSSELPWDRIRQTTFANETDSQFTIYLLRTSNWNTRVWWFAIRDA